jgi:hypothetical protein
MSGAKPTPQMIQDLRKDQVHHPPQLEILEINFSRK